MPTRATRASDTMFSQLKFLFIIIILNTNIADGLQSGKINKGIPTNRRQMLEKCGAGLITAALSTAPTTSNAADVPTSKPSLLPHGVLYRTSQRDSTPATPTSLLRIIEQNIIGSFNAVAEQSGPTRGVLCIGERHDCFEHHLVELRTIMAMNKALKSQSGEGDISAVSGLEGFSSGLAIGMECFDRQHQVFLDRLITSDISKYSLRNLMDDVKWDSSWGYDFLHYVPILEYAHREKIRLVGLDAPENLIDAVGSNQISSLQNQKPYRPFLPKGGEYDNDDDEKYYSRSSRRARLLGPEFATVPTSCLTNAQLRALQMEDLRDEYMAESASMHLERHDGWMILLAGTTHVDQRDGVPDRTLRRIATRMALDDIGHKRRKMDGSLLPDRANRGVFTLEPRSLVPGSPVKLPTEKECDLAWFVPTPEGFDPNAINLAPRSTLLPVNRGMA